MTMKHTIKINAGAAALLKSCLRRPEWPSSAQEIVTGLLLADKITVKESMAEIDAHKPVEFQLPESLRDLCKKAVDHSAKINVMPASEFSKTLILAFGLASPPKELDEVLFGSGLL
jgi:hypothetical protein